MGKTLRSGAAESVNKSALGKLQLETSVISEWVKVWLYTWARSSWEPSFVVGKDKWMFLFCGMRREFNCFVEV